MQKSLFLRSRFLILTGCAAAGPARGLRPGFAQCVLTPRLRTILEEHGGPILSHARIADHGVTVMMIRAATMQKQKQQRCFCWGNIC